MIGSISTTLNNILNSVETTVLCNFHLLEHQRFRQWSTMKQEKTFLYLFGAYVLLSATFLTTEAIPVALPVRDRKGAYRNSGTEIETYKKLRDYIDKWNNKERLIEELQINSHCPFQVLKTRNITRIMCDVYQITNCKSDVDYCRDISVNCHQAYTYLRDDMPSSRYHRGRKVEVGCIYHPKGIGTLRESSGPNLGTVF